MARHTRTAVALVALAAAVGGYYYYATHSGQAPQNQKATAPPPPDVGVIEVTRADVPLAPRLCRPRRRVPDRGGPRSGLRRDPEAGICRGRARQTGRDAVPHRSPPLSGRLRSRERATGAGEGDGRAGRGEFQPDSGTGEQAGRDAEAVRRCARSPRPGARRDPVGSGRYRERAPQSGIHRHQGARLRPDGAAVPSRGFARAGAADGADDHHSA